MRTLLTTLHSKYIHASLALPCLASYCGTGCGEIIIREYTVNQPREAVLAQIVACNVDVICFSVYVWNRVATFELVQNLKLIDAKIKIVLGGPEISFENDDFFDHLPVDAVICGAGEIILKQLLKAWQQDQSPELLSGLRTPERPSHNGTSLLPDLDDIPSPFAGGLVDLSRGLVYYESSRGCPYTCSFCMSAMDERVQSYSLSRIKADLNLLMEQRVAKIKFVDRTFNYDNHRAREIFTYILNHNKCSHFHFEIGAHLLDDETLQLLTTVPVGVFQFEIGVQSTLPETLKLVGRKASLQRLAENVRFLHNNTKIHLHLDLIAGLPGENYSQFLSSLDWTYGLGCDHLQIEPVKLLPGAPLRSQAEQWSIKYNPLPPYTILSSATMGFNDLQRLQGISALLDIIVCSGRFAHLLQQLQKEFTRVSLLLEDLDNYWCQFGLYWQQRSSKDLYLLLDDYLHARFSAIELASYREALGRDYALHERAVSGSVPPFIASNLSAKEKEIVRCRVKDELNKIERSGKVQYFATAFNYLPEYSGRTIVIFIYIAKSTSGLRVRELLLSADY